MIIWQPKGGENVNYFFYDFNHPYNMGMQMNPYNQNYFESFYPNLRNYYNMNRLELKDYGSNPFVINIEEATEQNNNYRLALWTGSKLQLTLMSIDVGGDIGLEMHPDTDQFLRIEEGDGLMVMGDSQNNLNYRQNVSNNYAIIIPAGKWHNLINIGNKPLKVYSLYAPPQHPFGTIQPTKAIAMAKRE